MEVSVVIPCHGGAEETRACLMSLRAQDPSPLFDRLQILVVDNASPDDTAAVAASLEGVEVLRQTSNLGFAGGVNAGMRAARGDFLIVINNDTLAGPNLIHRLLAPLLTDPRIGLSAPVSNHVKGFARIDTGDLGLTAKNRREIEAALAEHRPGQLQDVDSLSGLCLAMSRAAWQAIGEFDERFGLGNYEDDDFCLRARVLGYRLVIVRDAFLHHLGNRTFDALGLDYADTLAEKRAVFADKWQDDPAGEATLAGSEGDYETAARLAPDALRRHPNWPDGHYALARELHRLGPTGAAIPHLESFVAHSPTHTDAWLVLAFERMHVDGEDAGNRCLMQAMETCYFSIPATLDLLQMYGAFLLQKGRPGAAVVKFREAVELAPDSGHFHYLLGKALFDHGDTEAAAKSFAESHASGDERALAGLGACQWTQGEWQLGLETMMQAAAATPDDQEARANCERALSSLQSQGVDTRALREQLDKTTRAFAIAIANAGDAAPGRAERDLS